MPLEEFRIEFENPTRSYFPGQNISGRIVINSEKEKSTKGVEIRFEGNAHVHWTEERTETYTEEDQQQTRKVIDNIEERINYFTYKVYGLGNGHSDGKIPCGTSYYPFNFLLPQQGLPSSFIGEHGEVSYHVEAVILRPWKFDQSVKEKFTVNAIVDLNADPSASQPIQRRKEKNFCCFCCTSGPVGFVINLPKKGFVPGEQFILDVELFNSSNRGINKVSMYLYQDAKFTAKGKTKSTTKLLENISGPGVDPGDNTNWKPEFIVPAVPPTDLGGCTIITVRYLLKFELHMSGMAFNLDESINIILGTVPFQSMMTEINAAYPAQNMTVVDGGYNSSPYGQAYPGIPGMPMPTFQNSFNFGPSAPSIAAQPAPGVIQPQQPFVPQYPTFGWGAPAVQAP